jgi:hypothetical protein
LLLHRAQERDEAPTRARVARPADQQGRGAGPRAGPGKVVGAGQPVEVPATHIRAARTAAGQPERHSAEMGHETRVNRGGSSRAKGGGLGRGWTWPETEKGPAIVKFAGDKKRGQGKQSSEDGFAKRKARRRRGD